MKVSIAVFIVIVGAVLGNAGQALANEPQLSRRECARKAQVAAAKLREMGIGLDTEAAYAEGA